MPNLKIQMRDFRLFANNVHTHTQLLSTQPLFPFQYGGPGRGINDMNGMDPNQPRVSTRSR